MTPYQGLPQSLQTEITNAATFEPAALLLQQSQAELEQQREFESLMQKAWQPLQNWLEGFLNFQIPDRFFEPQTADLFTPGFSNQTNPNLLNNHTLTNILANPEQLLNGPVTFPAPELQLDTTVSSSDLPSGQLLVESQNQVNDALSQISDDLQREVHAGVAFPDGNAQLRFTAGTPQGVDYAIAPNTVYSAHTHLSGILEPTPTDLRNDVPGAQDAVVFDGKSTIYA